MGFTELNYINVSPEGTFRTTGDLSTSIDDIKNLFAHLRSTNKIKLAVHFHGGGASEQTGEATARRVQKTYESAGAHSVTFIWENSVLDLLSANAQKAAEGPEFNEPIRRILRMVLRHSGAEDSENWEKSTTEREFQNEFAASSPFSMFDGEIRQSISALSAEELRQVESAIRENLTEGLIRDPVDAADFDRSRACDLSCVRVPFETLGLAFFWARIASEVLKRFRSKRDHGLYPTVVEEVLRALSVAAFGQKLYRKLKNSAAKMWYPNVGEIQENWHPGRVFLEELKKHQKEYNLTVDIVGKSAGSIPICEMLRISEGADLLPAIRNIVFLAPACTMEMFHDQIVKRDYRFENFRMFTMRDEFEKSDVMLRPIYTRSQLYLLSGLVETEVDMPLVGMHRFWSKKEPFTAPKLVDTVDWLKVDGARRAVLSATEGDAPIGMRCTCTDHDKFDQDPATVQSLAHLIAKRATDR